MANINENLYKFIDCMGLLFSTVALFISITTPNIRKTFRPIFVSCACVNLFVTTSNLCDDVIDTMHNIYGGPGYIRLAIFGASVIFMMLHHNCFVYAEYLSIRSMAGKKSLSHAASLLLLVWILGLSGLGFLLAFARNPIVLKTTTLVCTFGSCFAVAIYYVIVLRRNRNNRICVEMIRSALSTSSPDDVTTTDGNSNSKQLPPRPAHHRNWDNIYLPRLLIVIYYLSSLPWMMYAIIKITDGEFVVVEASRSVFLLLHDLYYIYFGLVCVYLRLMTRFPRLPKLR